MTKADIVNEIAKNTGVDKASVLATVESFMDVVKDSLASNENVYLRGFGSFIVKKEHRKRHAIFQKILRSSFPNTISLLLSRLRHLYLR